MTKKNNNSRNENELPLDDNPPITFQWDIEAQQRGENPNGEGYAFASDARNGFRSNVPNGKVPGEQDAEIDETVANSPKPRP